MKKILCLIFSIFMFGACFTSCKDERGSGKISLLVSKEYGVIKPVDIYQINDGYINFWESNQNIELQKKYNYCAYTYREKKNKKLYGHQFLNIERTTYKITLWDSRDNQPADAFTYEDDILYFSEYFGEKENVSIVANVSFVKTLHVNLQEKNDTYKVTYYRDPNHNDFSNAISFNDIQEFDRYKKVIEVPKSDVTKIEYIL